jgi:hypothetical protein
MITVLDPTDPNNLEMHGHPNALTRSATVEEGERRSGREPVERLAWAMMTTFKVS